ncbi:MAG: hypothetical protein QG632_483 [Candidatus Dependentiae bacterium]|nr:hypothetical protein [Candidatus Dependentiae bacterium]
MVRIVFLISLCGASLLASVPNFIVAPVVDNAERSRNDVKEDFGNSLHVLVDTSARVQMAVGKNMMLLAALQKSTADQAAALVEDSAPFNGASTAKIAYAQSSLEKEVTAFEQILAQLENLTVRVGSLIRLEDGGATFEKQK